MNFNLLKTGLIGAMIFLGNNMRVLAAESAPSYDTPAEGVNAYSVIAERNIFQVVPPPSLPVPTNESVCQGALKLTGLIKTTGHEPRALFVIVPNDLKNMTCFNLAEGESNGSLLLLRILQDKEAAEVIYAGNRITVLLKDSKPSGSSILPAQGIVPDHISSPVALAPIDPHAFTSTPEPPAGSQSSVLIGGAPVETEIGSPSPPPRTIRGFIIPQ